MNVIAVVQQIIMLLIITAIGFWLRYRRIFNDGVIKGVNALVIQVAWPAMVLSTTQKSCTAETLRGFCLVAVASTVMLAAACLIVSAVVRARGRDSGAVFTLLCAMPNAGFVGVPLIQAAYGDEGVLYLAAFLVGFNLVLWTVGVCLFTGFSVRTLKCLLNPGMISTVIGSALFALGIALPRPLLSTVNQLGGLTTPLSMLLLGTRLFEMRPATLKRPRLWIAVAVKLILMPMLALCVMRFLRADYILTGVTVMAMAMPAASAAQILAEKHERDMSLAVQGCSVSMLLCIVTIPLILLASRL